MKESVAWVHYVLIRPVAVDIVYIVYIDMVFCPFVERLIMAGTYLLICCESVIGKENVYGRYVDRDVSGLQCFFEQVQRWRAIGFRGGSNVEQVEIRRRVMFGSFYDRPCWCRHF